jgi:hypothetical protein
MLGEGKGVGCESVMLQEGTVVACLIFSVVFNLS